MTIPAALQRMPATKTQGRSPSHRRHVRSTVDAVRMFLGVGLILIGLVVANALDSTLLGLSVDTSANVDRLPDWFRDLAAASLASIVIAGAVATAIWSLLTTRYRRFALFAAALVSAAALSTVIGRVVYGLVDEPVRAAFGVDVPLFRVTGADERLSPADPLLAAAVATLAIGESVLSRPIVRRAAAMVGIYAIGSVITIAAPPLALVVDVGVGLMVASALLWIFGRNDLALDEDDVRRSLERTGIEVTSLVRADTDAWTATAVSGESLSVMAFSRDDRSADLVFRLYRWLRLRKTGDHRPFVSLRRAVEHEALVSHQAVGRSVAAPAVRAVAEAGVDGWSSCATGSTGRSPPNLIICLMTPC